MRRAIHWAALALLIATVAAAGVKDLPRKYQDWLEQVTPLISKAERKTFLALEKDYQRDAFIERFWATRDPVPETRLNEFQDRYLARLDEALALAIDKLGADHPHVASIRVGSALASLRRGDLEAAEREARTALDIQDRFLPPDHPHMGRSWTILGRILTARGNPADAEPLLRQALELRRATLPAGDWRIAESTAALGECLAAQKRWAEAEPLLTAAAAGLRATLGPEHVLTRETESLANSARREQTTAAGSASG